MSEPATYSSINSDDDASLVRKDDALHDLPDSDDLHQDGALGEAKVVLGLAIPVSLTYALEYVPVITSLLFVGHLDKTALDAYALGTLYSNITALSLGYGISSAIDTLCSQINGAHNQHMIGVYVQRGVLISMLTLPIAALFTVFAEPILLALGQEPEIAKVAARFCWWLLPSAPGMWFWELLSKALQSQEVVRPSAVVTIVTNLLHPLWCWLFIFFLDWGYVGAALAKVISSWTLVGLLALWVVVSGQGRVWWKGWTRAALVGWKEFLALAVPGFWAIVSEWWAYEVLGIMSGWMSNADVALGANAILFNVATFTYLTYLGIGDAMSIRVGNFVGANMPKEARVSAYVGLAFVAVLSVALGGAVIGARAQIARLFSNDEDVRELTAHCLVVVGLLQGFDGLNGALSSVFRGVGRPNVSAWSNLFGFFVFGLPLSYVFGFYLHWGLAGLWFGLAVGVALAAGCCFVYCLRIEWASEVRRNQTRLTESASLVSALYTASDAAAAAAAASADTDLESARSTASSGGKSAASSSDPDMPVATAATALLSGVRSRGSVQDAACY